VGTEYAREAVEAVFVRLARGRGVERQDLRIERLGAVKIGHHDYNRSNGDWGYLGWGADRRAQQ
jgi:hypothetical protein